MIADFVSIVALHYIDKGMKAERELQRMRAAQEVHVAHESDKAQSRADKSAVRQQQQEAKRNQKHQSNGGASKKNHIQQPGKKD
jgi:hypothetical protein